MHGTYQLTEMRDGVYVYSRSPDLEALISSFPALSFVDPKPRSLKVKWAVAGLGASASALLLTIGASTQIDHSGPDLAPATGPASPEEEAAKPPPVASAKPDPAPTVSPVPAPPPPVIRIELPAPAETPPVLEAMGEAKDPSTPEQSPEVEAEALPAPAGHFDPGGDVLASPPAILSPSEESAGIDEQARDWGAGSEQAAMAEADILLSPPVPASPNQGGITHLTARVDGAEAGKVEFSDSGQTISVNLGSVLSILADRFPPEEYARLASSPAAQSFVDIDRLAEAGLGISYDPVYDEIVVDTGANAGSVAG